MLLAPGLVYAPGFLDAAAQRDMAADIASVVAQAPWFVPRMPRTGRAFSVRMTNCGELGWVSDQAGGYRYQVAHPETGRPWPPIPASVLKVWDELSGHPRPPQACLVNFYDGAARMGAHQDRDEEDFSAPVVSISLGDTCVFRYGGERRRDPSKKLELVSGDVVVLGGASRLIFHGVDKVLGGSSRLAPGGGRINLTLRRVGRA
ncbi:alpha-ketoglutarate-dependent dioxygenase AlkB family protein [Methylocapsa palsarum]|uniref:Alkylated DNA repair protein (DNA oxidative demethylase) n=1 Tax=Methylocapsa palsarum TaxID=1612308 RepID=A0A1I4BKU1_9HYPH|nr:alpha-ketoglutarate-dependent dioxygenase AlkB [Methylocapsa palsarum]SFK68596.1 alkylated DNA repair protein (DNA oxidative demethylase) [Methylocapsa palsarum]